MAAPFDLLAQRGQFGLEILPMSLDFESGSLSALARYFQLAHLAVQAGDLDIRGFKLVATVVE